MQKPTKKSRNNAFLAEKRLTAALGAGCREFESRHSDQKCRNGLCHACIFLSYAKLSLRHPASKAGACFGPNPRAPPVADTASGICVQRSAADAAAPSARKMPGTANRRRSRGCREFESRHSDHISTMVLIRNHRAFSLSKKALRHKAFRCVGTVY